MAVATDEARRIGHTLRVFTVVIENDGMESCVHSTFDRENAEHWRDEFNALIPADAPQAYIASALALFRPEPESSAPRLSVVPMRAAKGGAR